MTTELRTDRPIGLAIVGAVGATIGAIVMGVAAANHLLAGGAFALAVAVGAAGIVALQTLE